VSPWGLLELAWAGRMGLEWEWEVIQWATWVTNLTRPEHRPDFDRAFIEQYGFLPPSNGVNDGVNGSDQPASNPRSLRQVAAGQLRGRPR